MDPEYQKSLDLYHQIKETFEHLKDFWTSADSPDPNRWKELTDLISASASEICVLEHREELRKMNWFAWSCVRDTGLPLGIVDAQPMRYKLVCLNDLFPQ